MSELNIDVFLNRARHVTKSYIIGGAKWDLKSQMSHIDEEIQELKDAKNSLEELEEGWDVIFTVITYFHLKGFDDYAIKASMRSTLRKIETRAERYLREHGIKTTPCPTCSSTSDIMVKKK